jgi:hypothetical protein
MNHGANFFCGSSTLPASAVVFFQEPRKGTLTKVLSRGSAASFYGEILANTFGHASTQYFWE